MPPVQRLAMPSASSQPRIYGAWSVHPMRRLRTTARAGTRLCRIRFTAGSSTEGCMDAIDFLDVIPYSTLPIDVISCAIHVMRACLMYGVELHDKARTAP